MNIKELKNGIGRAYQLVPGPERRSPEGHRLGAFDPNEWLLQSVDEYSKLAHFKNVATDHKFDLNLDHIREYLEPNFLQVKSRVIVIKNAVRIEPLPGAPIPSIDEQHFETELGEWKDLLTLKIKSRGNWKVIIRPVEHDGTKLQKPSLYPLIKESSVQLGSLRFPYWTVTIPDSRVGNYIGHEIEQFPHLEKWRFYQSGQFASILSIADDWLDQTSVLSQYQFEDWKRGGYFGIFEAVRRCSEVLEFANHLASTEVGGNKIRVEIKIEPLRDRILYDDRMITARRPPDLKAGTDEFNFVKIFTPSELANHRDIAVDVAKELFWYFHWDETFDRIKSLQMKLLRS